MLTLTLKFFICVEESFSRPEIREPPGKASKKESYPDELFSGFLIADPRRTEGAGLMFGRQSQEAERSEVRLTGC